MEVVSCRFASYHANDKNDTFEAFGFWVPRFFVTFQYVPMLAAHESVNNGGCA